VKTRSRTEPGAELRKDNTKVAKNTNKLLVGQKTQLTKRDITCERRRQENCWWGGVSIGKTCKRS